MVLACLFVITMAEKPLLALVLRDVKCFGKLSALKISQVVLVDTCIDCDGLFLIQTVFHNSFITPPPLVCVCMRACVCVCACVCARACA